MEKIIKAAVDRGASDLHIKAGDVFRARIDGRLVALTKQALTPDQTKAIALRLIQNEEVRQRIDKILDYDCSWGAAGDSGSRPGDAIGAWEMRLLTRSNRPILACVL